MVPLLDGKDFTVIVDKVVQKEKKIVLNKGKYKVGMEKWSKKYNAKLEEDYLLFVNNKQKALQVILPNVNHAIVQQINTIKEYKQVKKKTVIWLKPCSSYNTSVLQIKTGD